MFVVVGFVSSILVSVCVAVAGACTMNRIELRTPNRVHRAKDYQFTFWTMVCCWGDKRTCAYAWIWLVIRSRSFWLNQVISFGAGVAVGRKDTQFSAIQNQSNWFCASFILLFFFFFFPFAWVVSCGYDRCLKQCSTPHAYDVDQFCKIPFNLHQHECNKKK